MPNPFSVLKPFFEIRPGERAKTLVMFLYFFLTIALIYILKPVRGALFLDELGAHNLRYVYMGEGIFLIFVTAAYVKGSKILSRKIFFIAVLSFFAFNLVAFWYLFRIRLPYLSAIFYIWVASFSITMTTQFWLLANDIFNPGEAKRLFGLIISGGSAGGVMGGVLAQQAVRWIKTEELLLVAAGVVGICALLIAFLWNQITPGVSTSGPHLKQTPQPENVDKPLRKIFMGSSYLVMLVSLVVLAKISSTLVDNQFNRVVELSISGKEARTAFLGGFMAFLNGVSFLAQIALTSLCLRYLGLGIALAVLPVGLAMLAFPSFLFPVLGTGLLLKLFDGSMNYSLQQASKEVLFLPLSRELRYKVKPVIDMLGFRAAKSLAGLYIALCAPLLGLSDERLGILVLLLIPVWLWVAWRMKTGYSKLLRDHLLNRPKYTKAVKTKRATDVLSFLHDEKAF